VDGKVTLKVTKSVPHVLYPAAVPARKPMVWGEGSLVKDNGFESFTLADWTPTVADAAKVEADGRGNARLVLSGTAACGVSQKITGLTPGKSYLAGAWIQVNGGARTASFSMTPKGGETVSNFVEKSDIGHSAPNDSRRGSLYQHVMLRFTQPQGSTEATVSLSLAAGDAKVSAEFDDVRLVASNVSPAAKNHWFYEDFEHVDLGGYGPFTGCPGERTHLSETHAPYTRDTISGQFSLKSRDGGRVLRTVPSSLRFKPNTTYKVSFLVKGNGHLTAETPDKKTLMTLAFTAPDDIKKTNFVTDTPDPLYPTVKVEGQFTTGTAPDAFLALYRDKCTDFIVIDELTVDDVK
jgi:endo-alpha-N-acetylgalactosaminidase